MSAPTVDRIIRSHASRSGARPALVSCGRSTVDTVTWRMLDEATGRLATHLSELAARRPPSCLVVSLVANDLAELLALVACLRVDAPVLVVSGRQPVPMHDALLAEVHRTGHTLVVAGAEPPEVVPPAHPSDSAAPLGPGCLLLASGGSTGHPKLVVDRGIRATPAKPAAIRPFLTTGWRALAQRTSARAQSAH